MEITNYPAYELVKNYPGCPHKLGDVVTRTKIPGHQWPEFYRGLSEKEYELVCERHRLLAKAADIALEIEKLKAK